MPYYLVTSHAGGVLDNRWMAKPVPSIDPVSVGARLNLRTGRWRRPWEGFEAYIAPDRKGLLGVLLAWPDWPLPRVFELEIGGPGTKKGDIGADVVRELGLAWALGRHGRSVMRFSAALAAASPESLNRLGCYCRAQSIRLDSLVGKQRERDTASEELSERMKDMGRYRELQIQVAGSFGSCSVAAAFQRTDPPRWPIERSLREAASYAAGALAGKDGIPSELLEELLAPFRTLLGPVWESPKRSTRPELPVQPAAIRLAPASLARPGGTACPTIC